MPRNQKLVAGLICALALVNCDGAPGMAGSSTDEDTLILGRLAADMQAALPIKESAVRGSVFTLINQIPGAAAEAHRSLWGELVPENMSSSRASVREYLDHWSLDEEQKNEISQYASPLNQTWVLETDFSNDGLNDLIVRHMGGSASCLTSFYYVRKGAGYWHVRQPVDYAPWYGSGGSGFPSCGRYDYGGAIHQIRYRGTEFYAAYVYGPDFEKLDIFKYAELNTDADYDVADDESPIPPWHMVGSLTIKLKNDYKPITSVGDCKLTFCEQLLAAVPEIIASYQEQFRSASVSQLYNLLGQDPEYYIGGEKEERLKGYYQQHRDEIGILWGSIFDGIDAIDIDNDGEKEGVFFVRRGLPGEYGLGAADQRRIMILDSLPDGEPIADEFASPIFLEDFVDPTDRMSLDVGPAIGSAEYEWPYNTGNHFDFAFLAPDEQVYIARMGATTERGSTFCCRATFYRLTGRRLVPVYGFDLTLIQSVAEIWYRSGEPLFWPYGSND